MFFNITSNAFTLHYKLHTPRSDRKEVKLILEFFELFLMKRLSMIMSQSYTYYKKCFALMSLVSYYIWFLETQNSIRGFWVVYV